MASSNVALRGVKKQHAEGLKKKQSSVHNWWERDTGPGGADSSVTTKGTYCSWHLRPVRHDRGSSHSVFINSTKAVRYEGDKYSREGYVESSRV